jgi:DNA-directed RNA polymerase subunit RPC12/RpoP
MKDLKKRFYVRCIHCGGELYAMAVHEYNKREDGVPCHNCGKDKKGTQILEVNKEENINY